jgi:tRNA (adenine57-N1/adenine58-N1)-methyltransferase catalytic subunit
LRRRRPAKGAYPVVPDGAPVDDSELWTPEALGEREVSDKKIRKVRRDIEARPEL